MKRWLIGLSIVLVLALGMPLLSHAAGTVTVTHSRYGEGYWRIRYAWTGDGSDGTVPATASSPILGYVVLVVTDPGSGTAPDAYDVTLTTATGIDVMGGELASRSASATEQAVPKVDTVYGARFVSGTLTMNISNQDTASATGTLDVYIVR